MIAKLMAMQIVKDLYTYKRVPRSLKPKVKEELELMNAGHLAIE